MPVESRPRVEAGLIGATTLIALLLWISGLGDAGLWSEAELGAYDRVRAAMGEAVAEVHRAPPLPTLLRSTAVAQLGAEWGRRIDLVGNGRTADTLARAAAPGRDALFEGCLTHFDRGGAQGGRRVGSGLPQGGNGG